MNQGPMDLQIRNVRNVVILDLTGRLIMGEPERSLRSTVHNLLDTGSRNFAINLAEIKYIDSLRDWITRRDLDDFPEGGRQLQALRHPQEGFAHAQDFPPRYGVSGP